MVGKSITFFSLHCFTKPSNYSTFIFCCCNEAFKISYFSKTWSFKLFQLPSWPKNTYFLEGPRNPTNTLMAQWNCKDEQFLFSPRVLYLIGTVITLYETKIRTHGSKIRQIVRTCTWKFSEWNGMYRIDPGTEVPGSYWCSLKGKKENPASQTRKEEEKMTHA